MSKPETLENQNCPMCHKNSLTLTESETEVPYFGQLYLFSMNCYNCKYHLSDVEAKDEKEPCRFTFEVSSEEDLKVRVVKSSQAIVNLPHITKITPGPASIGYVTNIEGILNRVKHQIEIAKDTEEDEEAKKKAKNLLKKLTRIMWGQEKQKIVIEDPSGNSAIISDKAEKAALK